jgi:hypothetical protein
MCQNFKYLVQKYIFYTKFLLRRITRYNDWSLVLCLRQFNWLICRFAFNDKGNFNLFVTDTTTRLFFLSSSALNGLTLNRVLVWCTCMPPRCFCYQSRGLLIYLQSTNTYVNGGLCFQAHSWLAFLWHCFVSLAEIYQLVHSHRIFIHLKF